MRNYSFYPSIPGTAMGNMAMIKGNFMPSNPQYVGAGANKKFNPYIQGEFMPSNPDFIGVGAPGIRPESNIYSELKKNYRTGEGLINDEQNPYGKIGGTGLPTSDTALPTSIDKEKKIFEERKKKVEDGSSTTGSGDDNKKKKKKESDIQKWEKFMLDREKFSQDILNQAYIAGGASDAGKSILEGSKVAAESVVPNMIAGTTGLLASMAKGNTAIAAAFGIPISPMKRMGYYS